MFGGTSKRRKAEPFRLNPWLHGIGQTVKRLNVEYVKSLETQPRGGVALGVERNRTRAGVPNPVLHGFGLASSVLDESHETHEGVVSLCESQAEIRPSENPKGGTPVHIRTWARKNVYVCTI